MFTRELPDVDKRNNQFWTAYDEIMEAAREVATQRGDEYNRFCSVVDYYPGGVSVAALWPVHTKCLRLEQIVRHIAIEGYISEKDRADARETVRDLLNFAAFVYAVIVSEQGIPF